MNNRNLLLIIFTLLCGLLYATKGYSQEAFIKYTINDVAYNFKGAQVQCYQKAGDRQSDDKVDFQETSGFIKFNVETPVKLSIKIRMEKGKKIVVGKYPYQDRIPQTKILPNAYLGVEGETTEGLVFFGTNSPENGVFEITKVAGDWIEGTFEANISDGFDETAYIKVTKGSFRLRVKEFLK